MKHVFVDAYNVINAWPNLKEVKDYNIDIARQILIECMEEYVSYKGCKVILVFDAHLKSGSIEKKEKVSTNILVVFTKEGETADSYIEKTVNNIGRKFEVCVVTSDSLEQQVVFGRGATRMSSLEFYHEVLEIKNRISKKITSSYTSKKNDLADRIDEKILEEFEKMRRSK